VWEAPDIAERGLFTGEPTGSATPLGWAHAQYLGVLRALSDRSPLIVAPLAAQRYQGTPPAARIACFHPHAPEPSLPPGRVIRVDCWGPTRVRFTLESPHRETQDRGERRTVDTRWGIHVAELPLASTCSGEALHLELSPEEGTAGEAQSFSVPLTQERGEV
jgi:glucoamylase